MKRDKDEGALRQARMRDNKIDFAEDEITIEQDVEVEGARAVGKDGVAVTAEGTLQAEQSTEQFVRAKVGYERDHGIEKARLIRETNRRGGVERGARSDTAQGG